MKSYREMLLCLLGHPWFMGSCSNTSSRLNPPSRGALCSGTHGEHPCRAGIPAEFVGSHPSETRKGSGKSNDRAVRLLVGRCVGVWNFLHGICCCFPSCSAMAPSLGRHTPVRSQACRDPGGS